MILRSTDSRTRPTLRKVRSTTALRPLHHRLDPARVEEIPSVPTTAYASA